MKLAHADNGKLCSVIMKAYVADF